MFQRNPIFIALLSFTAVLLIPSSSGYSTVVAPGYRFLLQSVTTLPENTKLSSPHESLPITTTSTPIHPPRGPGRPTAATTSLYQSDYVVSSSTAAATMDDRKRPKTYTMSSPSSPAAYKSAPSRALSFKTRVFKFFGLSSGNQEDDGLTLRQRLAKRGVYTAMSYNVISQINSGMSTSIAWYFYSLRTGLSPLAAGQWKGFLGFYASFWVANNFLRPIRVALAVALAPRMERLSRAVQNRTRLTKTKAVTFTFIATYITSLACSATCLTLQSACSGIPIFPAR